jgi:hypothetical protein
LFISIQQRNEERKQKAANQSRQGEKFGMYVPRNKGSALQESGYSNAGVRKKGGKAEEEELDEESKQGLARIKASDGEIDAGIDAIARTMDNITNMAAAMREETLNQNDKLEKMDRLMDTSMQKQTIVNARQRQLLK